MNTTFTPDEDQRKVIELNGGYHIVLAPPGCGKTQILTERIRMAHDVYGVEYSDMLCLTFTNRAARGMMERIAQNISDDGITDVFVGNIHRYCIRILSNEGIMPANSAIIDDDDALSILSQFMSEDESNVAMDFKRRKVYFDIIHLSQMIHQIAKGYPRDIRLHPESLTKDEVAAMNAVCKLNDKAFTPESMVDMYMNADLYTDSINQRQIALPADVVNGTSREAMLQTLKKLSLAREYEKYKQTHNLVDFNDILLMAYDSLSEASKSTDEEARSFAKRVKKRWIQIDEVQDLSPLQMAIADLLTDTASNNYTIMYLGDEQQSIFSFMGTKESTMNNLRIRCGQNIHHLGKNHRSPRYLLEVFNEYADKQLGISRDILPQPAGQSSCMPTADCLSIMYSGTVDEEHLNVAKKAKTWLDNDSSETTAIIVLTNAEAEAASSELTRMGVDHFKISGTDLFSTPEMKLITAHLNACHAENNQIAWARIIQGTHAIDSPYGAREFVNDMNIRALSPAQLVDDSYLGTKDFADCYENKTIIIFDTETTGLDIINDDIIQIAAMKIRGKEILDTFMVHIETDREIPTMLGDIVNPVIEERKTASILSHTDALEAFARFAGDAVLLAHNANFDIHILEHNVRRYTPHLYNGGNDMPCCFDSLRLIRLLEPSLKVYKLKHLLEVLHLEGANSHLADDDVFATKSLVDYCYGKAKDMQAQQDLFFAKDLTKKVQEVLKRNYAPLYQHTRQLMWATTEDSDIAKEMHYIHDQLLKDNLIKKVDKLNYACDYIATDMTDHEHFTCLAMQMMRYGAEINTLKEADLCNSNRIRERIYVTTVHKAKGLEFDNVIVFDAVDGKYPGFNSSSKTQKDEDARKFYVAISRAKKRLLISVSNAFITRTGTAYERKITPFMSCIEGMFSHQ